MRLLADFWRRAGLSAFLQGSAAARVAVRIEGAFGGASGTNVLVNANGVSAARRGRARAVGSGLAARYGAELRIGANRDGVVDEGRAAAGLAVSTDTAVVRACRLGRLQIVHTARAVAARLFVVRAVGARVATLDNSRLTSGAARSGAAGFTVVATSVAARLASFACRHGASAALAATHRLTARAAARLVLIGA